LPAAPWHRPIRFWGRDPGENIIREAVPVGDGLKQVLGAQKANEGKMGLGRSGLREYSSICYRGRPTASPVGICLGWANQGCRLAQR
jgi:hypothetical protein